MLWLGRRMFVKKLLYGAAVLTACLGVTVAIGNIVGSWIVQNRVYQHDDIVIDQPVPRYVILLLNYYHHPQAHTFYGI